MGKRQEWVKKVNREEKNGQLWQPKTDSVLCSRHFVDGGPSDDYPYPCQNLGHDSGISKPARKPPAQRKLFTPKSSKFLPKMHETQPEAKVEPTKDHTYVYKCSCTDDCTCTGCREKHFLLLDMHTRLQNMEDENHQLRVQNVDTGKANLQQNTRKWVSVYQSLLTLDKKVKFYTGLPNLFLFNLLFEMMEHKVKKMSYWRGVKSDST